MPSTRYGVSAWVHEFPRKRRPDWPRLKGDQSFPVVVVGGGLSGTMTAYALAAAGVKVALVEADRLGAGGSGRGTGVLQGEPAASYRDLDARYGRKAARAMFDQTRRAVLDLAATARRLGVRGVETHDALRVMAAFTGEEKALSREAAARRDAGLEAVWLKGPVAARESASESARAGVRLHGWGHANPYAMVVAFAAAAVARGAVIFERTAVSRMTHGRTDVSLHTRHGTLTAGTAIVCTGEPTALFRSLVRHVGRHDRYVVVTDRLPAGVRKRITPRAPIVIDTETPPHTIRWTADDRLVVAGADQPRPPARVVGKVLVQRTGQLMYEVSRLYPAVSGVLPAYGWDVPMGVTADGVLYAGPHRNFPRHLFAWGTGHDPAHAFLASRILLRHVLGQAEPEDGYFGFTRTRS